MVRRSYLQAPEPAFGLYPGSPGGSPTVLIVTDQEAWLRSLESVLSPMGYAVLTASTGFKVMEALRNSVPDLVIIQTDLADVAGVELCRMLRSEPFFDPCVPILLTSSQPFTREQRLEAFQSGAWDCYGIPFDVGEFLAKLANYSRVKQETDRARADSVSAYGTGLYSRGALIQVGHSLVARVARSAEPLAAVVFRPGDPYQESRLEPRRLDVNRHQTLRRLIRILPVAGRVSDYAGFLSTQEIALLAPGTDAKGAVRLAERLLTTTDSIESPPHGDSDESSTRLVAGCAVLGPTAARSLDVVALLERARTSLNQIQRQPQSGARVTATVL